LQASNTQVDNGPEQIIRHDFLDGGVKIGLEAALKMELSEALYAA